MERMWWRLVSVEQAQQLGSWWDDVDDSPVWQARIFYALAGAYLLIGLVALVSLQFLHLVELCFSLLHSF